MTPQSTSGGTTAFTTFNVNPSWTVLVYTGGQLTKDSVGNYHYDYTPTNSGTHLYRWEGTGTCVSARDDSFVVLPSPVVAG